MRTITGSVQVHRPVDEVAAVTSRIDVVMAVIGEYGRTSFVEERADGSQVWEVFIVIGTMYVGGRVQVETVDGGGLAWHSISGIQSAARFEVTPDERGARISVSVDFKLEGRLTGTLAGLLLRSVIGRYVDAVLERLRHRVEYGE